MTVPATGMISSKPSSEADVTCCWCVVFRVTRLVILGLVGIVVLFVEVEAFKGG